MNAFTGALLALILVSCATTTGTSTGPTPTPSLATGEQDALLVDQSFIKVANLIAATPGEPANVVSIAKSLTNGSSEPLDIVQTALQALIAGTPPPATISTFPGAINELDNVLADIAPIAASLNAEAGGVIIAAEVLLTTAETVAGVSPATATSARSIRVAHAASSGMSPDTARLTLRTYLAQHH